MPIQQLLKINDLVQMTAAEATTAATTAAATAAEDTTAAASTAVTDATSDATAALAEKGSKIGIWVAVGVVVLGVIGFIIYKKKKSSDDKSEGGDVDLYKRFVDV